MKNTFHSFTSLTLMSLGASLTFSSLGYCQQSVMRACAPTKAKGSTLPAAVRAELPVGALSVSLFQLAPAPKEKPVLFHLWTAARRNPTDEYGEKRLDHLTGPITAAEAKTGGLRPSPFVLDIFAPGAKAGQWQYKNSIVMSGTVAPSGFGLRFLDATKKKGYVISTTGTSGQGRDESSFYTVYVFPYDGWATVGDVSPRIFADFFHPLSGSTTNTFQRDANGLLQIKEDIASGTEGPPTETVNIWGWNADNNSWQIIPPTSKPAP